MKCPRCQCENGIQARFCVQCGFNFSAAMQGRVWCSQCGSVLPAGVKFCTSCGAPVANTYARQTMPDDSDEGTMILDEPNMEPGDDSDEGTMILDEPNMEQGDDSGDGTVILGDTPFNASSLNDTTMAGGFNMGMPFMVNQSDETVMLDESGTDTQGKMNTIPNSGYASEYPDENAMQQGGHQPAGPAQNSRTSGKAGGNGAVVAAIAALCVLIAAAAVVLFLVLKGVIKLPFELPFLSSGTEETIEPLDDPNETDVPGGTEKPSERNSALGVSGEQLADADALVDTGKGKIEKPEELISGMDDIRSAMEQYKSLGEEYGISDAVSEHMGKAYDAYVSAVIKHKDLMAGQELSGGIYAQITGEFDEAASYAEELAGAGFDVDVSLLESERDGFANSYRDRVIRTFNEFTNRDSWSRTEAWNLMDDMDMMFASDDLDDPIRLRYCYALAWWTQRQCEEELNAGTITAKGAAQKIAGIIEITDYNPMLIDYYIYYMHAAGQDCPEVEQAFSEVVERIEAQGLREDVDLAHFWYFNDFGEYSVDDTNGVTTENRQWIRERMSSVTF